MLNQIVDVNAAVSNLISSYHELNHDFVDELQEEPSAVEFMRYVAKNRPFIVRGGASQWRAVRKWNAEYLSRVMGDEKVAVAVTPHGNADSVVVDPKDGTLCFIKPCEVEEPFTAFLKYLREQESGTNAQQAVKYAQTQNDNLRGEYTKLFSDVDGDIAWSRVALGRAPEAINLWIGNSRSVTALHRDNYENIYCQIIGSKHFVLLPPVETACIGEKFLPAATYALGCPKSPCGIRDDRTLEITRDNPAQEVPFATWDPDTPQKRATTFSHLSKPYQLTLSVGDMLYLPALWYHKVSQSCSTEGICCAVNYWYDMDFDGSFYATNDFVRNIALLKEPNVRS
ncbi:MAG: hypothetical protein M1830_010387 [Pleopsidium flavum]|nr:MAG: hypothetical protein M1830_010387 [Pleopsidium flavum]